MIPATTLLHATTVSVGGKGVMMIGPSGCGKSTLALRLITLGAVLVSDDQTRVSRNGGTLTASVPQTIAGLIEAREIGLITVPQAGPTPVRLVIDLAQTETKRLPDAHSHSILDCVLPCLHKSENSYFPEAILLYVTDKQRFPDAQN